MDIPESPLSHFECNVFLVLPSTSGPIKTHFKVSGEGPSVLEDFESLISERLAAGYLPDTNGKGGGAAPVSGNQAQTSPGGARTEKFQHEGQTWYVNASRKEAGKFYVARKDKASGRYLYLKTTEVPDFIKNEYGDALS